MRRLRSRLGRLENRIGSRRILVHVFPDETVEEARAAHERKHGPIPEDAHVIVILHSFRSSI